MPSAHRCAPPRQRGHTCRCHYVVPPQQPPRYVQSRRRSHQKYGSAQCATCEEGYHLDQNGHTCLGNQCLCLSNGVGATLAACPNEGATFCASCDNGYYLASGICHQKLCKCFYDLFWCKDGQVTSERPKGLARKIFFVILKSCQVLQPCPVPFGWCRHSFG